MLTFLVYVPRYNLSWLNIIVPSLYISTVSFYLYTMQILTSLYKSYFGTQPQEIRKLPGAGSNRTYYRLHDNERSVIGAIGEQPEENKAFISYTKAFMEKGLPVPELLAVNEDNTAYLLEDLGDASLADMLFKKKEYDEKGEVYQYLKMALRDLAKFQTIGHEGLDYSVAFPTDRFDKQAILWDLNYFKYCFLKPADIPFREELLEKDFLSLCRDIEALPSDFFMFRDFQSRNIMIKDDELRYIDYQGGRKGPRAYDVVSLLYQARADIPQQVRDEMLEYFISINSDSLGQTATAFRAGFDKVVLLRTLQVLGAYGFRGLVESKLHFVKSIPFAVKNLKRLIAKEKLWRDFPQLNQVCEFIAADERFQTLEHKEGLTIHLSSFSYMKGYPVDPGLNGGGFVFDCRALPNPGRLPEYKQLTGMNQPVIDYLEEYDEVSAFVENAWNLVKPAVENYLERGFNNLSVAFGCTGGQHRSVYCAEQLKRRINDHFDVTIDFLHREQ